MENAQAARKLLRSQGYASLATISVRLPGAPFVSLVQYAMDDLHEPIFLLSELAAHSKNLVGDPRASLLVCADQPQDPMNAPRVTVLGEVRKIEGYTARDTYLARHPDARKWAGFQDFSWYRMTVLDVYYVGGFGQMGWVSPTDLAAD